MNNAWRNILAAAISLAASLSALAATHEVTVGDNFYNPNDLTIQVGDTVRWTNAAGGNQHDVVADDASFSSAIASSFVFERTFNSAAEVLYYCSVHSVPGANRNQNMNGRIVVQAGDFQINAGLNDAWFNPATNGQGFFITVFPDIESIFLAWFTYDLERPPGNVTAQLGDPGHRWITAFGPYAGDTATLDIEITEGGVFDDSPPVPTQSADGTITVTFSSCTAGEVEYNIPSVARSGTVPIQRIANDNVARCEALLSAP